MKIRFGSGVVIAVVLCMARFGCAAEPSGIDAIYAYAGTWKVSITHVDTPYSKAGQDSSTLHNDCWKSGVYLACRQIVDGDARILLVFTCKADGRSCTSYQIPIDGGEAGSGGLTLDGKTWTFPWSVTKDGKTTSFRVVNTWSSSNTIEFRQEFSEDQVHWTTMATGHETRAD